MRDIVKAIALGADAVYIATSALLLLDVICAAVVIPVNAIGELPLNGRNLLNG